MYFLDNFTEVAVLARSTATDVPTGGGVGCVLSVEVWTESGAVWCEWKCGGLRPYCPASGRLAFIVCRAGVAAVARTLTPHGNINAACWK